MEKNTTATILKGIGIAVMVICIIAALVIGAETSSGTMPMIVIISGCITGTVFIGFGEIIALLHKGNRTREAILDYLRNKTASKTVIEDIESNLPEI